MNSRKVRHVRTVNKLRLYRREAPDSIEDAMCLPLTANDVERGEDFAMSATSLNLGYQGRSDVVTKLVLGGDK